jgi:hypothetical protein
MTESARGIVAMEDGPLAEVTFHEDGSYQLERIIRKSALANSSLADALNLLAQTEGDDTAGSAGSYARVDLR